jgi:uncharacterized protein with PIN domain
MTDPAETPPAFFCDAMLGGLARWLRAAGYDAAFEYAIDDAELIHRARAGGRVLLSCDGPMFRRNVIRRGEVRALRVPQQLDNLDALRFVLKELSLPLRSPRCMACGGELREVPKHTVIDEAPPLAFRRCEQFWRCRRCGKLLWHGTHWQKVTRRLGRLAEELGA